MSARGNEEEEEEVGCGGGGANLSTREIKKLKIEGRIGEETTFCLGCPSLMFCPPSQPWRGKTKRNSLSLSIRIQREHRCRGEGMPRTV